MESNKKFEITKESLTKFQNQRSDLIEKLNSINQAIKGENTISNVFEGGAEEVYRNHKGKKNSDQNNLNKQIR